MPGFTESSITLNFPDTNYFRLADCPGYKKLSAHQFKEMDACWYDGHENLYWLIELKDFSQANLTEAVSIEARAWNIAKKAYDTVCMFLSVKHGYNYAGNLIPHFPAIPDNETKLRLVTVVHCDAKQVADVQLLHNSFRNKFKPYADLFGITNYGVIEHSRAIVNIPHNMVN